jgi:hypothetical protein
MTCEKHGTTQFGFDNCQPQLVPVYAEYIDLEFNNITSKFTGSIEVEVNVRQLEEVIIQTHKTEYKKVEYKNMSLSTVGTNRVNDNGNWFRCSIINLQKYIETGKQEVVIEVAKSGRGQYGFERTGYFFKAIIKNDGLYLCFDDTLVSAGVHAKLIGDDLIFNNNGGHEAASPNVPMYVGSVAGLDHVNLYIHFNGLVYYDTSESHCVPDKVSPVKTRAYEGNAPEIKVSFNDDKNVYAIGSDEYNKALNELISKTKLGHEITVTVFVNENLFKDPITQTVTSKTQNIKFSFEGSYVVNKGDPVKIVKCACKKWLA